jgi:glycyl-tRNA synthetase beta subunit
LFAVGLAPTGRKDPFGLRRAALGLVQNLINWGLDFDLRSAIRSAARRQPVEVNKSVQDEVLLFIKRRLRNLMLESGYPYDVIDGVIASQGYNPYLTVEGIKELSSRVSKENWNDILNAYSRCVRITRDYRERFDLDPENFEEDAERDLFEALETAESVSRSKGSVNDFLTAFTPMIPAINRFFDDVLVMTDKITLRQNRLGLLQRIVALADEITDLSKLEGF